MVRKKRSEKQPYVLEGGAEAQKPQASTQKAAGAAKWSETIIKISHMRFRGCAEASKPQASTQKATGAAKWSETIVKISHMCFRGAWKLWTLDPLAHCEGIWTLADLRIRQ